MHILCARYAHTHTYQTNATRYDLNRLSRAHADTPRRLLLFLRPRRHYHHHHHRRSRRRRRPTIVFLPIIILLLLLLLYSSVRPSAADCFLPVCVCVCVFFLPRPPPPRSSTLQKLPNISSTRDPRVARTVFHYYVYTTYTAGNNNIT